MTATLTHDPFKILLGHQRWANRELLSRAAALAPDEFHRRFDIGPGSLHDTLTHIIGAIGRWSDRIDDRTLRPSIEGRVPNTDQPVTRRTAPVLLQLNEEFCGDFAGVVERARPSFAEVREWRFGDESYRFNVAAAIIHVTNHSMHHRAQCMNMFRHLGKPVGADLDELEWQVAGEP